MNSPITLRACCHAVHCCIITATTNLYKPNSISMLWFDAKWLLCSNSV